MTIALDQETDMPGLGKFLVFAAVLAGSLTAGASPAHSGDRHRHRVIVVDGVERRVPWYHQHPWLGTGPGHYYSYYPDHVPSYPEPRTGYPVPIFPTDHPIGPSYVVRSSRVVVVSHVEWCAARYRSYDMRTDSYQPYRGPRRLCRSPYR